MFENKLPEQVHTMTDIAAESAQTAIKSTQRLANAALDKLSDASQQARASAIHASDTTAQYIRNDPIKAVLIAAAAGAATAVLISLATRHHPHH
ncbi:MAG: hypothetical protein RL032_210 [Pseudomonadota bacterium]|jgi:ElaB/YqjD/DUF883 family membrane-anchored ribosome-binding protein